MRHGNLGEDSFMAAKKPMKRKALTKTMKKAAKKVTKKASVKKTTANDVTQQASRGFSDALRAVQQRVAGLDDATRGAFVMTGMRDHALLRKAIELGGGEVAFVAGATRHVGMLASRDACADLGTWYVEETVKLGRPPSAAECQKHVMGR
jgi:hypothetical protein